MGHALETIVKKTGRSLLVSLFEDPKHWMTDFRRVLEANNALSNPVWQNIQEILHILDGLPADHLICSICGDQSAKWCGIYTDSSKHQPMCMECRTKVHAGGVALNASIIIQYAAMLDTDVGKRIINIWKHAVGINRLTPSAVKKKLIEQNKEVQNVL